MRHATQGIVTLVIAALATGCSIWDRTDHGGHWIPNPSDDPARTPAHPAPGDTPVSPSEGACDAERASGWRVMSPLGATDEDALDVSHPLWIGDELLLGGLAFSPGLNTWRPIADQPRGGDVAVWTGALVLRYGGQMPCEQDGCVHHLIDGLAYDPATDTTTPIPESPLAPRVAMTAVWAPTTDELIVWGGWQDVDPAGSPLVYFNDGAAFNLSTGEWRKIAPSPLAARAFHTAVWNGQAMVVYGGASGVATVRGDAAAYDPMTDTWTTLDVPPAIGARHGAQGFAVGPEGAEALLWGGASTYCAGAACNDGATWKDGAMFDGAAWSPLPEAPSSEEGGASVPRFDSSACAGDSALWVWGGTAGWQGKPLFNGASYDLAAGTWTIVPDSPLEQHANMVAVWTGCEAIVFGGEGYDAGGAWTTYREGAIYRP